MMTYKFYFFVLAVFEFIIVQISGQCRPAIVQDLSYDDHKIFWNPSTQDACTISHYIIRINGAPDWQQLTFLSNETMMDVSNVPDCADTFFEVAAISTENIEGDVAIFFTRTPAPPSADLNLIFFRLTSINDGSRVLLEWNVDDAWRHCVAMFNAVRYNEDDDEISSMYLITGTDITFDVTPCTQYVFRASAFFDLEREAGISVIRYTAPVFRIDSPEVTSFIVGTTTVDLTVSFPGPGVNRCPVTSLIVDSSPYFNISYPISGENQITRPTMSVHLTNLQADSFYWFRVSANNTAGPSDPYVIGIQTLPN